jgi:hypothetical protein
MSGRLVMLSFWNPALVLCGAGFAFHRSWAWFVAFLAVALGHVAAKGLSLQWNSSLQLSRFFHEFRDPAHGKIFAQNETEYEFHEIPPHELDWSTLKQAFPDWPFIYPEPTKGPGPYEPDEFLRLSTPVNPPVRVFQAIKGDGLQLPRASAYVNPRGVSLAFVIGGWDPTDILHKYMLHHEIEHAGKIGQDHLGLRLALLVCGAGSVSIISFLHAGWWLHVVIILYILIAYSYFVHDFSVIHEVLADNGALRALRRECDFDRLLKSLESLWKNQLAMMKQADRPPRHKIFDRDMRLSYLNDVRDDYNNDEELDHIDYETVYIVPGIVGILFAAVLAYIAWLNPHLNRISIAFSFVPLLFSLSLRLQMRGVPQMFNVAVNHFLRQHGDQLSVYQDPSVSYTPQVGKDFGWAFVEDDYLRIKKIEFFSVLEDNVFARDASGRLARVEVESLNANQYLVVNINRLSDFLFLWYVYKVRSVAEEEEVALHCHEFRGIIRVFRKPVARFTVCVYPKGTMEELLRPDSP